MNTKKKKSSCQKCRPKFTLSMAELLFYKHNVLIHYQNSSAPRKIINVNKPVERQNGKAQLSTGNTQNGLQKSGIGNMKNKPVPPAEPKKMKTRAQLNKVFFIFNFSYSAFRLNYAEIDCAPNDILCSSYYTFRTNNILCSSFYTFRTNKLPRNRLHLHLQRTSVTRIVSVKSHSKRG